MKNTTDRRAGYGCYRAMLTRCYNQRAAKYKRYGGAGIAVCDRWRLGEDGARGFDCFMADMGPRPSVKHSIERTDNCGNYEPSNCRWATTTEQSNNRTNNHLLTYKGKTMNMLQTAKEYGVDYYMLRTRINNNGWSIEDAIELPKRSTRPGRVFRAGAQLSHIAKLSDDSVRDILDLINRGMTNSFIAKKYGVSSSNICMIRTGKSWKHIDRSQINAKCSGGAPSITGA